MAAVSTIVQALLKAGDHIVSVNDVYGGVNRYFRKVASNFGITATLVDATDVGNVEKAITEKTKVMPNNNNRRERKSVVVFIVHILLLVLLKDKSKERCVCILYQITKLV